MTDGKVDIPAQLIEAAAAEMAEIVVGFDAQPEIVQRAQATRVLAAAFAECTVSEEFGHTAKVQGKPWHRHRCPTSTHRRLVIITPAVVVTPAQEETANG